MTEITITNQDTNEILLFGPIGYFGIDAETIVNKLNENPTADIKVTINSQGGDVTEGLAIANAIRGRQGKVTTQIVGSAFSMASAIAVAGHHRQMAENALFMLHEARVSVEQAQTSEQLNVLSGVLRKRNDALLGLYVDAANGQTSRDEIKAMMSVQPGTFLTAQEALNVGFIDEITQPAKIAASVEGFKIEDLPVRIRKTYQHMFTFTADDVSEEADDETAEEITANPVIQEPEDMATVTPETAAQVQPATPKVIRETCPGVSAEFVLEMIDTEATLEQVQVAFAKFQAEQIASLTARIAELEAQPDEVVPSNSSAPPVVKAAIEDDGDEFVDSDDPIEAYNRTCAETAKRYSIPLNEAKARVKKTQPALTAAYVDAFNASANGR